MALPVPALGLAHCLAGSRLLGFSYTAKEPGLRDGGRVHSNKPQWALFGSLSTVYPRLCWGLGSFGAEDIPNLVAELALCQALEQRLKNSRV